MKKHLKEIIVITIYILMGIQIALGMLWGITNLGKVPVFQESKELIDMSRTLVADEYTGYAYPLLIRGVSMAAGWFRLPMCGILYVIQLFAAYHCYESFLRLVVFREQGNKLLGRKRMSFYIAFIMTVPMILQVHLAVLPYSLASSLFVALLAKIADVCLREEGERKNDGIQIICLWIGSSMICLDYLWLSGAAVVSGVIWYAVTHKKVAGRMVLAVLISVLSINGLNTVLLTPGSSGKIQKSVEGVLLRSVVWPKFLELSFFWEPQVREVWDSHELMQICVSPEKVTYEFGPVMDRVLGKEEANRIYADMIKKTLKIDTANVLLGLGQDGVAYLCPPISVKIQLQGIGDSYTGWNYGRMKDYTPRITKYYVEYALNAWMYFMVAAGVLWLLSLFPKEWQPEAKKRKRRRVSAYCTVVILTIDIWYVLTCGNIQDYLRVPAITTLWAFLLIGMLRRSERA